MSLVSLRCSCALDVRAHPSKRGLVCDHPIMRDAVEQRIANLKTNKRLAARNAVALAPPYCGTKSE
jgi:hypothetical protein